MPKKMFRKKRVPRKGARRLGGPGSGRRKGVRKGIRFGQPIRNVARVASNAVSATKEYITGRRTLSRWEVQHNANMRIQQSDNITNLPSFVMGKAKKLSFNERVQRLTYPPVINKRVYGWSAECISGRKAFFGIPINALTTSNNSGFLYTDINTNYSSMTSNTTTADPTLITTSDNQMQRVYCDYVSEKLQMVNSSSNSLKGKIALYGYKRDLPFGYVNTSVPSTPINFMMYGSSGGLVGPASGNETTAGNGFKFDGVSGASSGYNYLSNYDMPGSTINSLQTVCCQTDLGLDVLSRHCKDFTGYFFTEIKSCEFSLKPGQQIDHYTIFNDLPTIYRQAIDHSYLSGISFYLVVSFQGGVVGDATLTTGDNVISTGTAQLSCILEEKRILGIRGKKQATIALRSAPLTTIASASQYIINPDTGIADTGGVDVDV